MSLVKELEGLKVVDKHSNTFTLHDIGACSQHSARKMKITSLVTYKKYLGRETERKDADC